MNTEAIKRQIKVYEARVGKFSTYGPGFAADLKHYKAKLAELEAKLAAATAAEDAKAEEAAEAAAAGFKVARGVQVGNGRMVHAPLHADEAADPAALCGTKAIRRDGRRNYNRAIKGPVEVTCPQCLKAL